MQDKSKTNSGKGYYYFKLSELEIIEIEEEKEERKMTPKTNYLNTAVIRFLDGPSSRTYEYANYEPELEAGDLCVVMSAHHGLGLARVEEIVEKNDTPLYREIVSKVDTSAFDARVTKRNQAAELKAKMQERAKKLQDIALYQMLAKDDPEMAQLLQDFLAIQ